MRIVIDSDGTSAGTYLYVDGVQIVCQQFALLCDMDQRHIVLNVGGLKSCINARLHDRVRRMLGDTDGTH